MNGDRYCSRNEGLREYKRHGPSLRVNSLLGNGRINNPNLQFVLPGPALPQLVSVWLWLSSTNPALQAPHSSPTLPGSVSALCPAPKLWDCLTNSRVNKGEYWRKRRQDLVRRQGCQDQSQLQDRNNIWKDKGEKGAKQEVCSPLYLHYLKL